MHSVAHYSDQKVLDEVAVQVELNQNLEEIAQHLAPLELEQRSWIMGQLAERYCPLCGRARERWESGRLRTCKHGDRS